MTTPAPAEASSFHPALRGAAQVLSVILHPLFIPVYILLFFLYESPHTITLDPSQKGRLAISFSLMYILFPLVTVLLAKGLGFVDSIRLQSQKDRIIPYIGCTIYYFWMWYVLHKQGSFPQPLAWFSLGVFLATSAGLILNAWIKISMHALAAGVGVAFLYILALSTPFAFGLYLSVGFLLTGLICTARLLTGDHNAFEVYAGLFVGALAMMIAYGFR
ncbi:MAG: hypothetical protein EOO16_17225 [Chitinophagaceae bacterium]|nr:MAG: hypothetical protein EOO16_17225 [Chitinophagaceae bacterium]